MNRLTHFKCSLHHLVNVFCWIFFHAASGADGSSGNLMSAWNDILKMSSIRVSSPQCTTQSLLIHMESYDAAQHQLGISGWQMCENQKWMIWIDGFYQQNQMLLDQSLQLKPHRHNWWFPQQHKGLLTAIKVSLDITRSSVGNKTCFPTTTDANEKS